jgi:hypothetical protein
MVTPLFSFFLMATKHLNVQYAPNEPIRLNVTGLVELTDVITAIANYYKDSISSPERIQVKYNTALLLRTWMIFLRSTT